MKMTSKGQVTIQKPVREKLGLSPGDEVGFREDSQAVYVVNETTRGTAQERENRAEALIRGLRGIGRKAKRIRMTSDQLMELTRGPFNDLDAP